MAEVFFNDLCEQRHLPMRAGSAGLNVVLDEATPEAILAVDEYGADLSTHRSQQLNESMVNVADVIFTMTESQTRSIKRIFPTAGVKTFTLLEFAGGSGDIRDPYGYPLDVYRQCARQIWEAVNNSLEKLRS